MDKPAHRVTTAHWEVLKHKAGRWWKNCFCSYCVTAGDINGVRTGTARLFASRMRNDHALMIYFGPHQNNTTFIGYAASENKEKESEISPTLLKHIDIFNLKDRREFIVPDLRARRQDLCWIIESFPEKKEGVIFTHRHVTPTSREGEYKIYTFFR